MNIEHELSSSASSSSGCDWPPVTDWPLPDSGGRPRLQEDSPIESVTVDVDVVDPEEEGDVFKEYSSPANTGVSRQSCYCFKLSFFKPLL